VEKIAYLAPEDFLEPLLLEVGKEREVFGRLVLAPKRKRHVYWAQNTWLEPQRMEISSVSDAAKKLKALQRNWVLYSFDYHRRAKLIAEQLPHVSAKPIKFPASAPTSPLGSWTLLSPNEILYSTNCSSPFPNGEPNFVEDKSGPPSRAYLKLWEAFTILGEHPRKDERCLEVGASPGGWSWVLATLGVKLLAVDRSPLDPRVMKKPGLRFQKGNALSVLPGDMPPFDWIFSDLACYPEKLFDWVSAWLETYPKTRFICTLKFQGRSHYAVIPRFAAIKGSRLLHLAANKHELTWVRI